MAREAGDKFFCPGSIVRIELDTSNPLAYGMPERSAGFFSFSAAYRPFGGAQTVAIYGMKDLLVSGWIEGEEAIAGQSAVVEAKVGAGRVVAAWLPCPAPWSVACDIPAAVQRAVDDSWSGEAITTSP